MSVFEFSSKESFSEREERILALWQKQRIFEKSVEKKGKLFSFYDGPPFATGLPHYGHLLAGTIKDVIPRYKTMKGFSVPRRFGWDCHGLPVENEIEKAHELSGASAIESFGIKEFNEECRKIVLRYTGEWKKTIDRIGRWVDFENTYQTMDLSFMESVWWTFSQLYQKGLVYEGFKVMPFSMKLGTPISNFEANLNYKDVDDPSLVVAFQLKEKLNTFFLAWTTTPWTLPSNLALIVGPNIEYAKVEHEGKFYWLAKERASLYFENPKIVQISLGKDLYKQRYRPLFDFFQGQNAFYVLLEDAVSLDEGTGIVHSAPAFGELDFFACQKEGIELVCPVDNNGRFTKEVPPFEGVLVKDADKEIAKELKKKGLLFSQKTIRHRYPFCWRSDTPLIYKAVQTWFVSVERIKDKLLKANAKIYWMPHHIKEGRFGKWLENARDWAISRNRYWGTPIPIFKSEDGEVRVISSRKELEEKTGKKIDDLHRHFIDDLSFKEDGRTFSRIKEVFDCWFESGAMPYAQNHYPFEGKELFEKGFPADFIAEGIDQTRGWFYTLTVLAAALFDQPAFKNIIVNGIVLASDGNKMSKRLKNYPDPMEVISKYGADAVRLYMLSSPAVRADDMRFSEKGVEQILRQALLPFWNAFVFFSTYAKIYHFQPSKGKKRPRALIDRWLVSIGQKLVFEVEEAMEKYDLNRAVEPIVGFIEQLTNWYIRRSRSRFWADEASLDRQEAFETLHASLLLLTKVAAPFIPFLTDAIYLELKTEEMPESVHLASFPKYDASMRNETLEEEVRAAQMAVSLGHALRKEHKLKVRQPLQRAYLITSNEKLLKALKPQIDLIAEELNVKEVTLLSDESSFVQCSIKPNFPVLGKKIGKLMPVVSKAMQRFEKKEIEALSNGGSLLLELEEIQLELLPEDVQIERKVKEGIAAGNQEELTVAIDTQLTDELLEEGIARELINKINTMRKNLGFEVTDRITVSMKTNQAVQTSFQKYKEMIQKEVLAVSVVFGPTEGILWDLNGHEAIIGMQKV